MGHSLPILLTARHTPTQKAHALGTVGSSRDGRTRLGVLSRSSGPVRVGVHGEQHRVLLVLTQEARYLSDVQREECRHLLPPEVDRPQPKSQPSPQRRLLWLDVTPLNPLPRAAELVLRGPDHTGRGPRSTPPLGSRSAWRAPAGPCHPHTHHPFPAACRGPRDPAAHTEHTAKLLPQVTCAGTRVSAQGLPSFTNGRQAPQSLFPTGLRLWARPSCPWPAWAAVARTC